MEPTTLSSTKRRISSIGSLFKWKRVDSVFPVIEDDQTENWTTGCEYVEHLRPPHRPSLPSTSNNRRCTIAGAHETSSSVDLSDEHEPVTSAPVRRERSLSLRRAVSFPQLRPSRAHRRSVVRSTTQVQTEPQTQEQTARQTSTHNHTTAHLFRSLFQSAHYEDSASDSNGESSQESAPWLTRSIGARQSRTTKRRRRLTRRARITHNPPVIIRHSPFPPTYDSLYSRRPSERGSWTNLLGGASDLPPLTRCHHVPTPIRSQHAHSAAPAEREDRDYRNQVTVTVTDVSTPDSICQPQRTTPHPSTLFAPTHNRPATPFARTNTAAARRNYSYSLTSTPASGPAPSGLRIPHTTMRIGSIVARPSDVSLPSAPHGTYWSHTPPRLSSSLPFSTESTALLSRQTQDQSESQNQDHNQTSSPNSPTSISAPHSSLSISFPHPHPHPHHYHGNGTAAAAAAAANLARLAAQELETRAQRDRAALLHESLTIQLNAQIEDGRVRGAQLGALGRLRRASGEGRRVVRRAAEACVAGIAGGWGSDGDEIGDVGGEGVFGHGYEGLGVEDRRKFVLGTSFF